MVKSPKDVDGIANSVDPDRLLLQSDEKAAYTVCPDLSVQILRIITAVVVESSPHIRVPTGSGKHGKWLKFYEKTCKNHGILAWDCFLDVNITQNFSLSTIFKFSNRAIQNHHHHKTRFFYVNSVIYATYLFAFYMASYGMPYFEWSWKFNDQSWNYHGILFCIFYGNPVIYFQQFWLEPKTRIQSHTVRMIHFPWEKFRW